MTFKQVFIFFNNYNKNHLDKNCKNIDFFLIINVLRNIFGFALMYFFYVGQVKKIAPCWYLKR